MRSDSHTPSFVARIHESYLARIKTECNVSLVAISIFSSESKKPSKLLIRNLIPPSLGHLVDFSCVLPLLNIQGSKELSYYFIVPILFESHGIPQMLGFTCSHHFIKDPIMLSLNVGPVNPLGKSYQLVLRNNHRLIKVLLECRVNSIINSNLIFNKPWIFLPLFPHQIYFAPVADLCSAIGI
jgi:hypothetical protein